MSSINDSGENEYAYEESNVVGKSENSAEEEDKKILKSIRREITEEEVGEEERTRKNRHGWCFWDLVIIIYLLNMHTVLWGCHRVHIKGT